MAKVSVIVPCYNVYKYIKNCLESLLNQQLKDLEIISVNDHSTDSTLSILKEYEKDYPHKIKTINLTTETGCSAARNRGLKEANGEFIGFVDGDDMVSLNMYIDFYYLAKQYNVSVVSGEIEQVNEGFKQLVTNVNQEKHLYCLSKNKNKLIFETPSCCNRLFKHELLKGIQFLNGKKYEDVAFTFPVLLKADKQLKINENCYFYRTNSNGIMSNTMKPNYQILDIIDDLEEIRRLLIEWQLFNNYKDTLNDIEVKFILATACYILNWPLKEQERKEILKLYFSICNYFNSTIFENNNDYIKEIVQNLKGYIPDSLYSDDELILRQKLQKMCISK